MNAIALSIRDNAQRPADFASNGNNVESMHVRERLRDRDFIDVHVAFMRQVLDNLNVHGLAGLNVRVMLNSFFVRSGHLQAFPNEACVGAAAVFVDAYDRILNLAADGVELNIETRTEFAAVFARTLDVFRAAGIGSPEMIRRRNVGILRGLVEWRRDVRNLAIDPNNSDGSSHHIEMGVSVVINNLERVYGLVAGDFSIDERIVAIFNAAGEELPEGL